MFTDDTLSGTEVAIIGMDGRFPGARNIEEFWENLKNGIESITFFSEEELLDAGVGSSLLKNPNYIKAGSILEDIDCFDAPFFGFIPGEVKPMDPQMRIFHQCAWKALEDAGYDPGTYQGVIGLYTGAASGFRWEAQSILSGSGDDLDSFAASHVRRKDHLATRIAYKLNLKGPSFTMATACSSSLVAIDLACQGILSGECDMALAGGVNVLLPQKKGYLYRDGMILSPDGHNRTFDAEASGTLFGSGIGLVVLKFLQDARQDGDHIYAVIKGFAVNNDGARRTGYTAPSVDGQAEVIRSALRIANIPLESVTYIETHGTATHLGDPVEFEALKVVFKTDKKQFCAIGSVKSNLGHLDVAAGVAALIKTVLAIKHRQIPPSLHHENPNQEIDFKDTPFYVNNTLKNWHPNEYPLRAGVSSFGIGGTNAHLVLEEWPDHLYSNNETGTSAAGSKNRDAGSPGRELTGYQLILLSAKTNTALDLMTQNLVEHLKKNSGINLDDVTYTLQMGRAAFTHRKIAVCSTREETIEALSSPHSQRVRVYTEIAGRKPVIFMFPGQGAQYVNMGRQLYDNVPYFRQEMDRCFEVLKPLTGYNIKEILYPPSHCLDEIPGQAHHQDHINHTEITQPVLFVFEYALSRLMMNWGIKPYAMIGHSIGEYVAAALAGVFSLEDALRLVVLRGKLMQQMPYGGMLGVHLGEEQLDSILPPELDLAAINAPRLCTVSGPSEEIQHFKKQLESQEIKCTGLITSHAYHSRMMEPVITEFQTQFQQVAFNKPVIPFIYNLTGQWITVEQAISPVYWSRHLREPIRFSEGVNEILKNDSLPLWMEIGPGNVLATLVKQNNSPGEKNSQPSPTMMVNLIRHPKEKVSDLYYLLTQLGQVWLYGKSINWPALANGKRARRISLPTYPFDRYQYPIDGLESKAGKEIVARRLSFGRKSDIADWFYVPSWERSLIPPLPAPGEKEDKENDNCWLVFIGPGHFSSRLLEQIKQEKQDLVIVETGDEFACENSSLYLVNPRDGEGFDQLFKAIGQSGKRPVKILHWWGITGIDPGEQGPGWENLDFTLDLSLYSLIYMVQAMGKYSMTYDTQVFVLTDGMQEVIDDELLSPEKAAVLGAVKVIPREYTNISCCSIDIVLPEADTPEEDRLVDQLTSEFVRDISQSVVAWRGNHRWVPVIKPHPLPSVSDSESAGGFREQGVYLITGGLGGIGFTLAEHLAKRFKARLILIGRTAVPPGENADSDKIKKVRQLESLGARVLVLSADTADLQQMETVITTAENQFGTINGVIHAAGVADYAGVIQRRSKETIRDVLAPKLQGTLVLDELMTHRNLDFFIMCSSISSLLGPFGQVGYTAANAFLDAFALYRTNHCRMLTQSINWGAWQQVGMAVDAAKQQKSGETGPITEILKDDIAPFEGIDIFKRIIRWRLPQVAVYPKDLQVRLQQPDHLETSSKHPLIPETGTKSTVPLQARPGLSTLYVAPRDKTEQQLAEIWQNFLALEKVGVNDNFFELGANSLDIVHVNKKIEHIFDRQLPVATLFTYPTIAALKTYLHQEESAPGFSGEEAERLEKITSKQKNKLKQRKKSVLGEGIQNE